MELHLKYRPRTFDDVVGHSHVVASLLKTLADKRARSFLLTGPSGVGKTTIARLIAAEVGISSNSPSLLELDAATRTGVDNVRELQELLQYAPIGENKKRIVILDEAHMLTKSAWNALLKSIEEPPPGVYWCFCTTDIGKIPRTILTRCAHYALKPVDEDDIFDLLKRVVKQEQTEVPEDILSLCAGKSEGSPRQALLYLAKTAYCRNKKQASRVLQEVDSEQKNVIDLCRLLVKGGTWAEAIALLKSFQGVPSESVRRTIQAYFTQVALNSKEARTAERACAVLEAFSTPYQDSDSLAPAILSLASLFLGDET